MYFPLDSSHILRHPSQLYEALFEGVLLFILLWVIRKWSPFDGFLFAVYLVGYGTVRFLIAFFREPDPQIGYLFSFLTMGQILCIAMILLGRPFMDTAPKHLRRPAWSETRHRKPKSPAFKGKFEPVAFI